MTPTPPPLPERPLCACGCGSPVRLATCTDASKGYVKGQPMRTVKGHAARVRWREDALRRYTVDQATGCWNWAGVINSTTGYGVLRSTQKWLAHRFIYEALRGPIAEGLQLDHLCRNTACVNPEHLEPVTPAENNRRSHSASAMNLRKTHCAKGHEFTPENTKTRPSGYRTCLTCRRAWDRNRSTSARKQEVAA